MTNHPPIDHAQDSPSGNGGMWAALDQEMDRLGACLLAIREDPDLTPRDAADARIAVLEQHLEKVRAIHQQHLG